MTAQAVFHRLLRSAAPACALNEDKRGLGWSNKGMRRRSLWGCVPLFGDKEGEAPPVESGANALIAFKFCIENNRRADSPD